MDNHELKQILAERKIPKSTVAELADILPTEMSAYLRNRREVSESKAARIEQAVCDVMLAQNCIAGVVQRTGLPISLNLRDTVAFRKFVEKCKELPELEELQGELLNLQTTAL
jgi:predicted transcriptional regulator